MATGNFCFMASMKSKSRKPHGGGKKSVPAPTPKIFEAPVDHIGAKGDGLAQGPDGPVYIPYTAPGDVARIEAVGERGTVLELISQGPDRVTPSCPLYGACGGCALQHVSEEFYRQWKENDVRSALSAGGHDQDLIAPMLALPAASRRRAQFYGRRGEEGGGVEIGFYARRSRQLVAVDDCLVLHPVLNRALPDLKALAAATPARWRVFSMSVTLCEDARGQAAFDVDFSHKNTLHEPTSQDLTRLTNLIKKSGANIIRLSLEGAGLLTLDAPIVRFNGFAAHPPPRSFLQASLEGQEALIKAVSDAITNSAWALRKSRLKIADLFCGSGAFALPLSAYGAVSAYDSDEPAIATLKEAAKTAQRAGAKTKPITAEARNLFTRPLNFKELESFDAVILDPPRAGAVHQARELAKGKVPMVVYVSCNPKTFARDAKIMTDGGYLLRQVTPVDQFVYASHIEIVGIFTRG